MENESGSRLSRLITQLSEKLNEQAWFQQLKSKWDELDPQSRLYLQIGSLAGAILLVLGLVGWSMWDVASLKHEVAEKADLVNQIQSANDEVRRLRESAPGGAVRAGEEAAWGAFLEAQATAAGLDKAVVTVGQERAGANSELAKESLIDVSLKKVNLRQLVRFAFQVESSGRPVKIRSMSVDTRNENTGWLDATFHVSAFTPKAP